MEDFTSSNALTATADEIAFGDETGVEPVVATEPKIPDYLQDTYYWAYISPRNVPLLDREIVVRTILWQQHKRLQRLAFAEIEPGQRVMQPASVYGSFGPNLAKHVGPEGHVDIIDVAKIQVNSTMRKLAPYPWAHARHANCLDWARGPYDVIVCYFLLHEVPDAVKHEVVDHLLGQVEVGGKVVFVDYAKPKWWHPLKLITSIVFDTLEPFAKGLWRNEVRDFAREAHRFGWRRETIFGELFQKVVATRER
ncbi:MAG: class I SAM-dependent methyltransferase [Xanthomonadales bacterium]|nr:rhodoquinone biosynthesis methyltransferase RquA [Gammaproteobacteria bacterium]MBT8049673.1 rhodoquinone biosynthesis methyltransferase RquA [Gammaproteobacteria bacterium]MBT8056610.1 rhodoquinone biosynthesis methyltransferase RquA [Gammaproteobacteria bacterium]NNJ78973.1 class I SAM-dependent methyltransferase [Xanthomonadales bacterium]NNL05184.1 class I SAM-dependent methyltransferase [Xanthomonadales bacterium]